MLNQEFIIPKQELCIKVRWKSPRFAQLFFISRRALISLSALKKKA